MSTEQFNPSPASLDGLAEEFDSGYAMIAVAFDALLSEEGAAELPETYERVLILGMNHLLKAKAQLRKLQAAQYPDAS